MSQLKPSKNTRYIVIRNPNWPKIEKMHLIGQFTPTHDHHLTGLGCPKRY